MDGPPGTTIHTPLTSKIVALAEYLTNPNLTDIKTLTEKVSLSLHLVCLLLYPMTSGMSAPLDYRFPNKQRCYDDEYSVCQYKFPKFISLITFEIFNLSY